MLRIDFYHDGQQVFFYQIDKMSLFKRIALAVRIMYMSHISISTISSDEVTVTQYKMVER